MGSCTDVGLPTGSLMPASLSGQLVVAISSRALFDFEEEKTSCSKAQMTAPTCSISSTMSRCPRARRGLSLVRKLLAFNQGERQRVEVVILSRNDPGLVCGVLPPAKHYGLPIERGVFTRGRAPGAICGPAGTPVSVGQ